MQINKSVLQTTNEETLLEHTYHDVFLLNCFERERGSEILLAILFFRYFLQLKLHWATI